MSATSFFTFRDLGRHESGESLRVDRFVCRVDANLFFQHISLCITGFVGSSTSLVSLVSATYFVACALGPLVFWSTYSIPLFFRHLSLVRRIFRRIVDRGSRPPRRVRPMFFCRRRKFSSRASDNGVSSSARRGDAECRVLRLLLPRLPCVSSARRERGACCVSPPPRMQSIVGLTKNNSWKRLCSARLLQSCSPKRDASIL